MKKGFTLIELLSVIVILSIIVVIAYPKIIDVIQESKLSAYNSAKGNIIEGAKLKYLADVSSAKVTEYTVDDLITGGYLSKNTKNPLTMEDYENTKILITNENNNISFNYVEGNTLYDIVSNKNTIDGLYKENDTYIYKGVNANNYISFNGQIYRILKIDSYRNVYLLKDEDNSLIKKEDIYSYGVSYYNDNYSEKIKSNVLTFDILNYNDYINSFKNNETYIINNSNIWIKKNNEYKYLTYLNNDIIDSNDYGNIRFVLKLKNYLTVVNGNGTQLKPYIVNE